MADKKKLKSYGFTVLLLALGSFLIALFFTLCFLLDWFSKPSHTTAEKEDIWNFTLILSTGISTILFFALLVIKLFSRKLKKITPNIDELKKYFGRESFIKKRFYYKGYCSLPQTKEKENAEELEQELKNGVLRTRRYFFSSFFYIFFVWVILYVFLFYRNYEGKNYFDKLETFVEYYNGDFKSDTIVQFGQYKELTIKKDSILIAKGIFFTNNDSIKISRQDSVEKYCYDKCNIDSIFGMHVTFSNKKDTIQKKHPAYLDSLFEIHVKFNGRKNTIPRIDKIHWTLDITTSNDATFVEGGSNLKVMDKINDSLVIICRQHQYEDSIIETKKTICFPLDKQESLTFCIEKQIGKIRRDTMLKIVENKDTTSKWFSKNTKWIAKDMRNGDNASVSKIRLWFAENNKWISKNMYTGDNIEKNAAVAKIPLGKDEKFILGKSHDKQRKEYQDKDKAFAFGINLLSMLTNVLLLLFFGFLNTKTNVFGDEKHSDDYLGFKMVAIAIGILICLVDAFITFTPSIDLPALHFAIGTIIAIVSVIAIFGVWGTMNNSYTKFEGWFKFFVFIYAAIQIFAVFLESTDHTTKVMGIVMLGVIFIGKILIMYKILDLISTKKLSWSFLNDINEGRTNSYDEFIKLFEDKNGNEIK